MFKYILCGASGAAIMLMLLIIIIVLYEDGHDER